MHQPAPLCTTVVHTPDSIATWLETLARELEAAPRLTNYNVPEDDEQRFYLEFTDRCIRDLITHARTAARQLRLHDDYQP